MSKYSEAKSFFEINMIKDFNSKKMETITDNEIDFLKRNITNLDAYILDVMCGYGRLGNRLHDSGYKNIFGVDMGTFDFIPEQKKFNFDNADFYNWIPPILYDYCYSLYNSYDSYETFLKTIDRCKLFLKENGILIIDIFNKVWRDRLPNTSYRIVSDNKNEKIELFRNYDGLYEKSIYKISNENGVKEYLYSQCVISKDKLLEIVSNDWDITITDSNIENTRDDDQKNILILRKKVRK